MARASKRAASPKYAASTTSRRPTFPYAERPGTLRRFLTEAPKHPRPAKVNADYLAALGMAGGANRTIIRVLRRVGLINEQSEPTDVYAAFMRTGSGPAVLGDRIRQVYAPLFEAHHRPDQESNDVLRNLFNIHSGGAGNTVDLQIQTFRALCENADFDIEAPAMSETSAGAPARSQGSTSVGSTTGAAGSSGPSVHIDLHIHLPPGRSSRDYQYIIQDIARYIYGSPETGEENNSSRAEER
jgi:hypothetical protein